MAKSYHSTARCRSTPQVLITCAAATAAVLISQQSTTPAVESHANHNPATAGCGTRWQIIGALRTAWPR